MCSSLVKKARGAPPAALSPASLLVFAGLRLHKHACCCSRRFDHHHAAHQPSPLYHRLLLIALPLLFLLFLFLLLLSRRPGLLIVLLLLFFLTPVLLLAPVLLFILVLADIVSEEPFPPPRCSLRRPLLPSYPSFCGRSSRCQRIPAAAELVELVSRRQLPEEALRLRHSFEHPLLPPPAQRRV